MFIIHGKWVDELLYNKLLSHKNGMDLQIILYLGLGLMIWDINIGIMMKTMIQLFSRTTLPTIHFSTLVINIQIMI
jgi:hypothetical protein